MKKLLLSSILFVWVTTLFAQDDSARRSLYNLENRIIAGDRQALFEIAPYLDNKSKLIEFLGYHRLNMTPKQIATRIIKENCLVSREELELDSSMSSEKFLHFLDTAHLLFDNLTGMFLIKPLEQRITRYEIKELSAYKLASFDSFDNEFPDVGYISEEQMKWNLYLRQKQPESLLYLASAWYKTRARFNRYLFLDEQFLDLMKSLTHIDVGVPDEDDNITFFYKDDYYANAKLNYLIYWLHHYKDYDWDSAQNIFVNKMEIASSLSPEEKLFELLSSENDSTALNAFIRLSELDTGRVQMLARDYAKNRMDRSYSIPIFPYRFLPQMALLTQYCRDGDLIYKATDTLLKRLNMLKEELTFSERYRLEDFLIENLRLEDVTAVEYFGLIYEENWDCTYSVGRILDKFYSRKWTRLTSNRGYLEAYLKKSQLYDRLGIIGMCNNYLNKFENCSPDLFIELRNLEKNSTDNDIKTAAAKASSLREKQVSHMEQKKNWEGNNDRKAHNLKGEYSKIIDSKKDRDHKRFDILHLMGRINYSQIGDAITLLKTDTILDNYDKYEFIESDFGFEINPEDTVQVAEFLAAYNKMSEIELYRKYLRNTSEAYFEAVDAYDFNKIYDILKFDVVDAFVGGGGGRRDVGVYLIIKLLELRFNTTLGFPTKRCSWQGIYGCNCADRAEEWMKYLDNHRLVTTDPKEPRSVANLD